MCWRLSYVFRAPALILEKTQRSPQSPICFAKILGKDYWFTRLLSLLFLGLGSTVGW